MDTLDLTNEEIRRIVLLGRRFLINESTHPDDLKVVLMERLRESQPSLTWKIEQMDKHQLISLCRMILAQQQSYT